VRKVYAGPRNPRTGEQIIAGYSPGSESPGGYDSFGGWKTYITDPKKPMRVEFWKKSGCSTIPTGLAHVRLRSRRRLCRHKTRSGQCQQSRPKRIPLAWRNDSDVLGVGGSSWTCNGRGRLLRIRPNDDGRTAKDRVLFSAVHGTGDVTLRRGERDQTSSKVTGHMLAVRCSSTSIPSTMC